ncbi:MAG: transcription-repair coupling factor [Gammaproteobacteria bacterium]
MPVKASTRPSNTAPLSPWQPALPDGGTECVWTGLQGDSVSLAIAAAVHAAPGPVMLVTADMRAAEQIRDHCAFFTAGRDTPAVIFPDWETLPYDSFSPYQDIISERLATLYRLPQLGQGLLIVAAPTLMQRLPPVAFVTRNSLILQTGEHLDLDRMREQLDQAGYHCVSQVMEHGEFAVRGALLDLFPMGSDAPYRIDLLDDEIESIKTFNPEDQRSLEAQDAIRILPAREFPFDESSIKLFRRRFRATFEGDPQARPIYREVSKRITPTGIEYYLPLFFDDTATLFDYLPDNTTTILLDGAESAFDAFEAQVQERYAALRHDHERPLLEPTALFINAMTCLDRLSAHARIRVSPFRGTDAQASSGRYDTRLPGDVSIKPRAEQPAAALQHFIGEHDGRILFTAESTGRRETLQEQLHGLGIHTTRVGDWAEFIAADIPLAIGVAPLEQGFVLDSPPLAVIPETRLFGERARQARRRRPARDPAAIVRNLTDLEINAPVVHEEHGVGRYLGLETIEAGGIKSEYLALAYAGGDKLYVPVAALDRVSRYTGATPEGAPLHRLGSDQWERARRKASKRIRDVAAELLDIYARRAARRGHAHAAPEDDYAAFAATFPFEETPDQEASIDQVLADMQSATPMDRLVCGDVGFGKTEVAMRAAFLAVQGGKQVALLVPTTLLAQQHFQNFRDRFSDWPVRIELLSRFRNRSEQQETLQGLAEGSVDIAIGTHKLLQPDVHFKRLGLLIIDEEHRFGVRQKEQIKQLRAEVDILTLTATPIPRTLNMSLAGMRDLSIISTPPPNRLAVKTFVSEWNKTLVREACLREIKRGGQMYFLHNDLTSIDRMASELATLVPEAEIGIAHGQMRERDLEQVMLDFYHRRYNLLLCSTIIESGIDVPTANTIIINRADKLGLAQLHQLRGRVGRSHHRAYAYLITPPSRAMSADAVKRLAAVASMEELGAGFTLATHDLEIRGAGELLGEDQSGQIHEIGFTLYTELLERAVSALKEGRVPELDAPLHQGPEIELQVPALLPDSYIPDVHTRLVLYKRIAGASSREALDELQVEMIDRFGLLPDPAKHLFRITALKLLAAPMGVRKIELGQREGRVQFTDTPAIDSAGLISLVQTRPQQFRFDGSTGLRLSGDFSTDARRFDTVSDLLDMLAGKPHNLLQDI